MATKKDKDEIRSAKMTAVVETLSKKFDDDKVQEKPIPGGKKAKYVKSQEYIAKLNETFGVAWSLEIMQHWLVNNQVCMWVRIHYPNPDYPDNAGCREFKDGIAGHPLAGDAGNAFKAVYSKAFTIAASKIGAGLQLWGVETSVDDVDEAPTWDSHNTGTPPVTVVNPGAHNMPPVPGVGSAYPPPVPGVPPAPVPTGMPPVPQPVQVPAGMVPPPPPVAAGFNQPPPPPPQFANGGATAGPPVQNGALPLPPPPVPTGNPAAVDTTNAAGLTSGPNTPAVASVGIPSSGTVGGIEDFQVNGILGAAVTRGVEPLQLVFSILGNLGISDIGQLTAEQAQKVMDAARQMPPQ